MSDLRVLISGSGIAGPVVAHFLTKLTKAKVTIVERSPELRATGQNVDVRGNGLEVIRRMGLEEVVRSKVTHEQGLKFIDGRNRVWAEFPVDKGQGFTSEIEIIRGDLSEILYNATKNDTEYIFGESISSITESSDSIEVEFSNGTPTRTFDILVGADGWTSKTRGLAFGQVNENAVKSLGQYTAYFSIPYEEEDGEWAEWYNAPGGRLFLVRPDKNSNITRIYMAMMSEIEKLESALSMNTTDQKALLRDLFEDAGWKAKRILDGMDNSDDFYYQKIAQVKMDRWSIGRTVLVGDAAYCPSPISGMGTTSGITGAYFLAGEIANHIGDHASAFKAYEDKMRPFATKAQTLMPGTPWIANPQSWWGIYVLNSFLWFVTRTGLSKLAGIGEPPVTAITLPRY